MTDAAGLTYLLRRIGLVEDRIRALVLHRRADDPAPDDPFRGLYVTDEVVDQLLAPAGPAPGPDRTARAGIEAEADAAVAAGHELRQRRLATDAGLTELDTEILVVALVPDLDSRFERLYGYLNDDVTRRRATIALALALADVPPASAAARARLMPGAPLIDRSLVVLDDVDRPFLTRALRVPDRVAAHLLGDDGPDPTLVGVLTDPVPFAGERSGQLARALQAGHRLCYVRETGAGLGASVAAAALQAAGRPVLGVDLTRLAQAAHPREAVTVLGREALLRGAGVVAGPVESLVEQPEALRMLTDLPGPVAVVGRVTWDPAWTDRVPLVVDAGTLTPTDRIELWAAHLPGSAGGTPGPDPIDLAAVPAHFVLGPHQVARAVAAAAAGAALTGGGLTAEHLRRGARAQNAAGLERLARRVEPAVGWDDIVLPDQARGLLRDLAARARNRDRVLVEWRMRQGGGRGRGVTALFAGDSGTGKTMSAEVIAGELGLDLYTVNLATVVDKYVGETEKNLERIFSEAGGVNAVLLFDEADAIFGKRSEVRDAHDRYANIESAYLLQRMETFDGLAILSTNLRSNIDDAFTRRLDMIIDFPAPDERSRLSIWQRCLRPPVPVTDDLDLDFCARAFTMSGGNIRSAATTAGYLAAGAGGAIGMPELIAAIAAEYRKMGRLVLEREFGPYLIKPGAAAGGGKPAPVR
ncbi:ATP-binding protein [Nakamurella sp.]|uniref:ATP-binding protein n=1 Tax=Nakamurella sp. TaxID=1869182 RepID=UPI003B3AE047